jgi:hypothetical protein
MIVYHGSNHVIGFPDYAEAVAHHSGPSFPLGLWVTPLEHVAREFGWNVYEIVLDAAPLMLTTPELLNKPRHIHIRDGRDVMVAPDRNNIVVINFDVITSFRYIGIDYSCCGEEPLNVHDRGWRLHRH